MAKQKKHPPHIELIDHLAINGIRMDHIWKNLSLSQPYFHQIIYGIRPMPDRILNAINALLNTDFKQPEPIPEILPHEQLEADKQSLQEKPLFKDQ